MSNTSLKFHWMAHRTRYLIALGLVTSSVVVAFIVWTIAVSVRYYSKPKSEFVAAPVVANTPTKQATMPTSVRCDVSVGELVYGDKIIVSRDLSKVIGDRLEAAGYNVDRKSSHAFLVEYRETVADPIDVRYERSTDAHEFGGSIQPIAVEIQLSCTGKNVGFAKLLESRFRSAPKELVVPDHQTSRKLSEFKRRWYRTSYASALSNLRSVQLPARKPEN